MLFYFLKTSTWFNNSALVGKYDKTVRDGVSKVCNVNADFILSAELALPAQQGSFWVPSASLLALPAIFASAFDASDSHNSSLGKNWRRFIQESSWKMAKFDEWTAKTSRWNQEKLDTTCLRQNRPRFNFSNGWQKFSTPIKKNLSLSRWTLLDGKT